MVRQLLRKYGYLLKGQEKATYTLSKIK